MSLRTIRSRSCEITWRAARSSRSSRTSCSVAIPSRRREISPRWSLVPSRHLSRLFLRRFLESDLVSPDADRVAVISQVCAGLITGGLFVTVMLSLQYLESPFPLPNRTSVQVVRVQYLYSAWSMVVMALVAVFVWDALALDSRDTAILGPLPVKRGTILRAKISALLTFMGVFAAALNVVPAIVHPVLAVSRLRPGLLVIPTLLF